MNPDKFLPDPQSPFDFEFLRAVKRKINALLNAQVTDQNGKSIGTVNCADGNTVYKFTAQAAGSSVQMFAITALTGGDYFTALPLTNFRVLAGIPVADLGAAEVKIAKPPTIRRSITGELIDGTNITYRDAIGTDDGFADNNRIDNNGSQDESQCVYPRYIGIDDLGLSTPVPLTGQAIIYAAQMTGASGVFDEAGKALDWLEIQPARVWAKRFNT